MSVSRGNLGYGGAAGTSQTSGDTNGNARGFIVAAAPPGGGHGVDFSDPDQSAWLDIGM